MSLSPYVESTLTSAVESMETARELVVLGAEVPFCLKDALNELIAAETKVRNALALIEEEKRRESMLADTERPAKGA